MWSFVSCKKEIKILGQLRKAFEPSFDAKPIYTEKFLYQKLDYIHHNPVKGKWNLCGDFTTYLHSSAILRAEISFMVLNGGLNPMSLAY